MRKYLLAQKKMPSSKVYAIAKNTSFSEKITKGTVQFPTFIFVFVDLFVCASQLDTVFQILYVNE